MVRLINFSLLCLAFLISMGCAGVSKQAKSQVTFQGAFSEIQSNPDPHQNEVTMLGGKIVEIKSAQNESEITVLQMPLAYNDRPRNEEASQGRFLVRYDQFLDPAIFEIGKYLTVVGRINGREDRLIGEYMYTYPVLAPIETKLWGFETESGPDVHFGIGVGTWF
jgi:outer membrane lipoprotein